MFLPTNAREFAVIPCVTMVAVIVIALNIVARTTHGDDVQAFLEEHGMHHLLAVHLEQQLSDASDQQRADLIQQIAMIYAMLLEGERNEALREVIENRSAALLRTAPENTADQLRLALLRAEYRRVERTAEHHRLRRAEDAEIEEARAILARIIPELQSLTRRIEENRERLQRQLGRAADNSSIALERQGDRMYALLSEARFLVAWALYYQAMLHNDDRPARDAFNLFLSLLDPERPSLRPDDVSVDLRNLEPMARTILGAALSKAFASASEAREWLHLLRYSDTHQSVRETVEIWDLAILLQGGSFAHATEHVEKLIEQYDLEVQSGLNPDQDIATTWLRMAAVHAMEARGNFDAEKLARMVFTKLASMGALDQIVDLARRFGPEALGSGGFARHYVQGVLAYQAAREIHRDEHPTTDASAIESYALAERSLRQAINAQEAQLFAEASHVCRRLLGMSLYFRSAFLDARDALMEAAAHLPPNDAVEAHWMAIVAMDKVVQIDDTDQHRSELNRLISDFVDRYPSSHYAPRLVLKRAITGEDASPETVEQLLAVPESSDVYHAARSQASVILYRLFIAAEGAERIEYGSQFLSVALPLLRADELQLGSDSMVNQRYISRCRQILEVALTNGIERLTAARVAIRGFYELHDMAMIDVDDYLDEIDYRRVRERILSDDPVEAQAIAEAVWQRDSNSIWARLSNRALFSYAHERVRTDRMNRDDTGMALAIIVRYGGRVLHEYDDVNQLANPQVLAYFVAVAEASFDMWQRTGDAEMGRRALFLFRDRLLAHRPNNGRFLRSAALLAEALDDHETALNSWRRLVAGTAQGTLEWFEAKFKLIATLEQSDPVRARAVMDQHTLLYPDYGPNPWGARLRALDARLPRTDSELNESLLLDDHGDAESNQSLSAHPGVLSAGGSAHA